MRLDTGSPSPRTVWIEVAEPNSRFSTSAANSSTAPGPRSSPEDPSSASRKSSLTANERRLQKNSYPCLLLRTEKKKTSKRGSGGNEAEQSRLQLLLRRSKSDKVKPNFGRAERIKFNAVFLHIRRGRLSFSAFSYGTDCIASHAYSAKCREEESRLGGRGRRRKGPREKEREHGVFFSVGRQKTAPTPHHTTQHTHANAVLSPH